MTTLAKNLRALLGAAVAALALQLACAPFAAAAPGGGWWRPGPEQRRLDVQLGPPFNLARPTDILVLELFGTAPETLRRLRAKGTAPVCRVAAGLWENWRPDAGRFPEAALGRSPTGWRGERWLDVRHPGLRPVLEARLDLCRERGFAGALLAGLDGPAQASGFDLQPADRAAFARWLAGAAHARGLGVGAVLGDPAQAAELAPAYDFLVADGCATASSAADGCVAPTAPFRAAGKPVFLVAYTNDRRRMDAACAAAAGLGLPLVFKTRYPNGKLHRRCA